MSSTPEPLPEEPTLEAAWEARSAQQEDVDDLRKNLNDATVRIQELTQELVDAEALISTLTAELEEARGKHETAAAELTAVKAQLSDSISAAKTLARLNDDLQKEINRLQAMPVTTLGISRDRQRVMHG